MVRFTVSYLEQHRHIEVPAKRAREKVFSLLLKVENSKLSPDIRNSKYRKKPDSISPDNKNLSKKEEREKNTARKKHKIASTISDTVY